MLEQNQNHPYYLHFFLLFSCISYIEQIKRRNSPEQELALCFHCIYLFQQTVALSSGSGVNDY